MMDTRRFAAANDEIVPVPGGAFPADAVAVISCPAPAAVSSGRARKGKWLLEFAPRAAPFVEPLMGWTGSSDTLRQVRLWFPTRAMAVAYAQRQGLRYEVHGEPALSQPISASWAAGTAVADLDALPPALARAWNAAHLVPLDEELAANHTRSTGDSLGSGQPPAGQMAAADGGGPR